MCPSADVVYGCDGAWWKHRRGLPGFAGTKLCHDTFICATYKGIHKVEVCDHDRLLFDKPGVVGSGGNSGFMAINMAAQFGANRILLIGFDMHAVAGVHWHGRHGGGLINPSDTNFVRFRGAVNGAADTLRRLGIDVVNASPDSALHAYPKMTAEDAMRRWRLP